MSRTLLLAAGLLVVCGGAQPPAGPPAPLPGPPIPPSRVPGGPTTPGSYSTPPLIPPQNVYPQGSGIRPSLTAPVPPAEMTVEQLLKELEAVQAQRAELEKREAALKAAVRTKLDDLNSRLEKLGAGPGAARVAGPDRVGHILIETANRKEELAAREIFEKVGLRPGEPLRYPALEAARGELERIRPAGTSVDVVPGGPLPGTKDIRVRFAADADR